MNILKSIMKPFYSAKEETIKEIAEDSANRKTLETKLESATGLSAVADILISSKKEAKDRAEKKALRDTLINM